MDKVAVYKEQIYKLARQITREDIDWTSLQARARKRLMSKNHVDKLFEADPYERDSWQHVTDNSPENYLNSKEHKIKAIKNNQIMQHVLQTAFDAGHLSDEGKASLWRGQAFKKFNEPGLELLQPVDFISRKYAKTYAKMFDTHFKAQED